MTSPMSSTTVPISLQLFAAKSAFVETQNFLRILKIESFGCTVYEPAGRVPQPASAGSGAEVAAVVAPVAGSTTCGTVATAWGGMRMVSPGYGNCAVLTHPLYASSVVTEIPYLLATAIGESPACTV